MAKIHFDLIERSRLWSLRKKKLGRNPRSDRDLCEKGNKSIKRNKSLKKEIKVLKRNESLKKK